MLHTAQWCSKKFILLKIMNFVKIHYRGRAFNCLQCCKRNHHKAHSKIIPIGLSWSADSYDPWHMVDMMAYYIILHISYCPYHINHIKWSISDVYKHMIDYWVFENRISFIWLKLTWISKKQIHLKQDMKSHCSVFLVVESSQKYIVQLKLFTWLTVRKASAQYLKLVLLYIHFWKHFERYSFDRMVVFALLRCQQPTTMVLYMIQGVIFFEEMFKNKRVMR